MRMVVALYKDADRNRWDEYVQSCEGMSLMYTTAVNGIEERRDRFAGESYPEAEAAAERLIALPTHCLLSSSDLDVRAELCESALNGAERTVMVPAGEDTSEDCHNN